MVISLSMYKTSIYFLIDIVWSGHSEATIDIWFECHREFHHCHLSSVNPVNFQTENYSQFNKYLIYRNNRKLNSYFDIRSAAPFHTDFEYGDWIIQTHAHDCV